ncbi:MAG: glucose-6-phosphate dehydrogenase [Actinobacteria bacterium 69-20]|jgi:glucose-6-phosphate 1-dehydrogenase|nr:glucose-6-phosphate dehydrogenase [Actinomycetota bacterium]OJV29629.1 MAG: glucose-6-phosphate dehydrogenase [Actinobacteria bacterium 69-20]
MIEVMAQRNVPIKTLLILGGSGDLSGRLLLPGIGGLLTAHPDKHLRLIGSGADEWDDAKWRQRVTDSFASVGAHGPRVDSVIGETHYRQANVTDAGDWPELLKMCEAPVAIFFALPPPVTAKACEALTQVPLPAHTRLVLEKPFGTNEETAAELNDLLTRLVPEDHIHRVDHFLGKSTVLNLLGLRFANRMLEPVLTAEHVEKVDVIFDENLALEGRAGYYDGAGALVDMVQSHLLQVLSILAMEPPSALSAADLRDHKAGVLRATHLWKNDPVHFSRRARYTAGRLGDRDVPNYVDEKGINPANMTETLAEVVLAVDTWRWHGVPFRIRTGKAIGAPRKEAIITFKQAPRLPHGFAGGEQPNRIVIGFGPDTMSIALNVNGPGDPLHIDQTTLSSEFGPGEMPAYGEVLLGVLDADPTLSVRGDTAEDCWRIVQPVLDAWRADRVPLQEYPAGSAGPAGWPL